VRANSEVMEVNTAATAASKALPPALKISVPASVASLEPVEMMLLFKIGKEFNYGFY
jgi:hypothetical protein